MGSADPKGSASPGVASDYRGMDLAKIYGLDPLKGLNVQVLDIPRAPVLDPRKHTPPPHGSFGPLPLRTKMDKILYCCGATYLLGLTTGGLYGATSSLKFMRKSTLSVWHTMFMNQTARYGSRTANSMGVLSLGWTIFDNILELTRGKSDYLNHLTAAFLAGSIYKSTAGLRPALLMGSVFTSLVGTYGTLDHLVIPEKWRMCPDDAEETK